MTMSLADEYRRQLEWRDWPSLFAALPPLHDQLVIDLGCGPGDQAAMLVARGARVLGLDGNQELLEVARAKSLANAEFRRCDLSALPELGVVADGLWSSFSSAYFVDLPPVLASWARPLRRGGWIALTEIDDLFGHEPLSDRTREQLGAYTRDSLQAGRYDFHMGRRLRDHVEQAGFVVARVLTVRDDELAFDGPARPEVVDAWRARFARLKLLGEQCGEDFPRVRDEFLACLARSDHRSTAKVCCCIAHKIAGD
jgi:SAM-dependent methyltransferase